MLWKKMYRDLRENKLAYLASIIIIVIGLMVFTSYSLVLENLTQSKNDFYTSQNFADGFARVKSMPAGEVEKLKQIEGIADIEGRLVKDVRVTSFNREENVYLRLVSIDPDPEQKRPINGVALTRGIPLQSGKLTIWVDDKFFAANELQLHDQLEIIADGKKRTLRVMGSGKSPEFVYALRTSSELYPSPETFGIAYIPHESMRQLFTGTQTVNELIFTLSPGAEYQGVEEQLKTELKPYQLESIFPRKDQVSNLMLTQELKGLAAMSKAVPILFLSIAAMILYIMLKRIVEQQRGQIGILKAFGYTRKEILYHYLSYALVIGTAGGAIGGLAGIALSHPFTKLYQSFFNMPGLISRFSVSYLLLSILMSLAFSLIAGYQGCRRILALEPAEAMQPPAPPPGRKTLWERIAFFWGMLTIQGNMAMRNISRNKGRSLFIFAGIMFTFALSGMTWSMKDLSEKMLFQQYEKVETYDVRINYSRPLDEAATMRELTRFPGVERVEPLAEIPVTLKKDWHKKEVVLLGLSAESTLYNILDDNSRKVDLPANGVLISQRLAELLDARPGSRLVLDSVLMKNPDEPVTVQVAGVVPQYLGLNAYMEIDSLQRLLNQGELTTSAMLRIDESAVPELKEAYGESAAVSGIDHRLQRLNKMKEMLASYSSMTLVFAIIGMITGFAIIYNSSVITLSERRHELATMMVLGMTPAEVLSVITFEQWFLGFFAMLAGIPAAKLLLVGMAQSVSNDVYTIPTTITGMSILLGSIITVASIWIAQRTAARRLRTLRLTEVLNSRE